VADKSEWDGTSVVFEMAKEHVGDERFARADFAGEQDEAAALFDGVD